MRGLRRSFGALFLSGLMLAVALGFGNPVWSESPTCPKCGAGLEAGAAFCSQCGAKVGELAGEAPAQGPDSRASLVQVIAIHDREMSSVFEAIAYGSTVRVDSLLGSGFAVAPGEFVTDTSLLLGAREVKIRDSKGRSVSARIVGIDPLIGIGLLAADLTDVPVLPRGGDELPRQGDALTALGYSSTQGMAPSVTSSPGVVSGLHRAGMEIHPVEDYIQSDASLPRGFAGGPGLDAQGRLVGMSTAFAFGRRLYLGPTVGIGLFIPAEWMDRSLSWIRSGQPARAWIGAHLVPADPDNRKLFGLPSEIHWVVEDVFPGSPAELSGLRRGDGIVMIQGSEFKSLAVVQIPLLKAHPGDVWTLEIYRQKKQTPLELTLKERPASPRLVGADALRFYGGLEIAGGGSSGLTISRVLPGTDASAAKLKTGDVLASLYTKKDMVHVEKSDARWRGVKNLEDLEEQIPRAYGDLDFALGLKFRCQDGEKREILLYYPLTATNAL
ncbi:MAG: trypsin-like peptidase domain-containing protein [Acidobacteria bacterium]|nr:trypsin-like peptidase domain-containing protein [Acidobacteriota bacterium]